MANPVVWVIGKLTKDGTSLKVVPHNAATAAELQAYLEQSATARHGLTDVPGPAPATAAEDDDDEDAYAAAAAADAADATPHCVWTLLDDQPDVFARPDDPDLAEAYDARAQAAWLRYYL